MSTTELINLAITAIILVIIYLVVAMFIGGLILQLIGLVLVLIFLAKLIPVIRA